MVNRGRTGDASATNRRGNDMLLSMALTHSTPRIYRLAPSLGDFAGTIHEDCHGIYAAVVYVGF